MNSLVATTLPLLVGALLAAVAVGQSQITSMDDILPPKVADRLRKAAADQGKRFGDVWTGQKGQDQQQDIFLLVNPQLNNEAFVKNSCKQLGEELRNALARKEGGSTAVYSALDRVANQFLFLFFRDVVRREELTQIIQHSNDEHRRLVFCFDLKCSVTGKEEQVFEAELTLRVVKLYLRSRDPKKKRKAWEVERAECMFSDRSIGTAKLPSDTSRIQGTVVEAAISAIKNKVALSLWANPRMQKQWFGRQTLKMSSPSLSETGVKP